MSLENRGLSGESAALHDGSAMTSVLTFLDLLRNAFWSGGALELPIKLFGSRRSHNLVFFNKRWKGVGIRQNSQGGFEQKFFPQSWNLWISIRNLHVLILSCSVLLCSGLYVVACFGRPNIKFYSDAPLGRHGFGCED